MEYYAHTRPIKSVKYFVSKWDVENDRKIIHKRAIARVRKHKFYDFDNITDTRDEDDANRLFNWETRKRIQQHKFDKVNLAFKFPLIQLFIEQKDFEWLD